MKNYKLEQFLKDSNADIGTGLLVTRGFGLCFTLKKPSRWGKTNEGLILLPFGGIGGKLEENELPAASLYREAVEEVASNVKIFETDNNIILMDSDSIEEVTITTDLPNEPLPIIIFRSPRAEIGRKPYTNVIIYAGKFTSSKIEPVDDPALIELSSDLLLALVEKPLSIKEFKEFGGKITSRIELPENGILKPIGTAIAIARCLKANKLDLTILEK